MLHEHRRTRTSLRLNNRWRHPIRALTYHTFVTRCRGTRQPTILSCSTMPAVSIVSAVIVILIVTSVVVVVGGVVVGVGGLVFFL